MTAVLEVANLVVRRGTVPALGGVSLRVLPGEAVALLGANGAGKTTLLRAVAGLVRAVAGTVHLHGTAVDAWRPERRARAGLGYSPEGRRVFAGLSVRDNLLVASRESRADRGRRLCEMWDLFPPLRDRADDPAWQLSGGQAQMVALARALMSRPRLLLLDEPSLGLAPAVVDGVVGQVPRLAAAGVAVLLADSNPAPALLACTRAVVLRAGHVVLEAPTAGLAGSAALHGAILGHQGT